MRVKILKKKAISDSDFQRKIENMKNEISGQKVSTTKKGNT